MLAARWHAREFLQSRGSMGARSMLGVLALANDLDSEAPVDA